MDLSKIFLIGTDYKDRNGKLDWENRVLAEVVLIDKSHPSHNSLVYQLTDADLANRSSQTFSKTSLSDAFLYLGDVVVIDKKNKQILLDNRTVVQYNYLIVISGSCSNFHNPSQETEFSNAIQALIEALRFKNAVPQAVHNEMPLEDKLDASRLSRYFCCDANNLGRIPNPRISFEEPGSIHLDLGSINKRLYEVQF